MAKIDRRATLETCIEAMEKQGCPSADDAGVCLYRGPDGIKCAAGHLIPDDEYDPEYEHQGASEVSLDGESFFGHDLHLVEALQNAHDAGTRTFGGGLASNEHWRNAWRESVRSIVREFGIEMELPKGWE